MSTSKEEQEGHGFLKHNDAPTRQKHLLVSVERSDIGVDGAGDGASSEDLRLHLGLAGHAAELIRAVQVVRVSEKQKGSCARVVQELYRMSMCDENDDCTVAIYLLTKVQVPDHMHR